MAEVGRGGGGDSRAASLKVLMILLDAFAVYVNSAGGEEDAKAGHAAATAPLIVYVASNRGGTYQRTAT